MADDRNVDKYQKELEGITAAPAFKEQTKQQLLGLLDEKGNVPAEKQEKNRRATRFPLKRVVAIAAALVVLVVGFPLARGLFSGGGAAAPQDLAAVEEAASLPAADMATGAGEQESFVAGAQGSFYFSQNETTTTSKDITLVAPEGTGGVLPQTMVGESPGGAGFEGVMLFEMGEHSNDWPWQPSEEQPQSLPVFVNTVRRASCGQVVGSGVYEEEEMETLITQQAAALGLVITEFRNERITHEAGYSGGNEDYDYVSSVTGFAPGVEITAYQDGSVGISLGSFAQNTAETAPAPEASFEEHVAFLRKMMEEYAPLLAGMQEPVPCVLRDRNIYGEMQVSYYVYDGGGPLVETLINRSFNRASFSFDENGALSGIGLEKKDVSAVVGEYPVVTEEEARQQLAAGGGQTTAFEDFPGVDKIAAVDLVYYQNPYADYYMPFYKFYVALPQGPDIPENLKTFGVWYVAAIQPEYITSTPVPALIMDGGEVG